jgi:hypothetical protein
LSTYSNGPANAEVQQDRHLRPFVDEPAAVGRLRHAELSGVQERDRALDGVGVEG